MSSIDRQIIIELTIKASQPELLEGLDAWLRLGLISEDLVRQICRDKLTCPLPQPVATTVSIPQMTPLQAPIDFVLEPTTKKPKLKVRNPKSEGGMVQALMAELSVRWLLFLGVFMVVVSSGVLAASQWEKFPAAGQYGVLLAYTLIFWGVSFWAGKQTNLQLTARTLQIVTLFLVPVNFWAMDSFGLWQNPLEWIVIAIATITLTAVTFKLLKNTSPQPRKFQVLSVVNVLGLSYLHWGWNLSKFSSIQIPLIAVYVGAIGTSFITFYQIRHLVKTRFITSETNATPNSNSPSLNLAVTVVVYALVVLLGRAIFVVGVPVTQLGLAIAICGWLVTWLAQQETQDRGVGRNVSPEPGTEEQNNANISSFQSPVPNSKFPWETIGGSLLFIGWLVCVGTAVPWQATGVSGLGLWFFSSRLTRFWRKADLAVLLGIGLQTTWLIWRLVPQSLQQQAIAILTQLTNSQDVPWTLLSLTLFPYLIFIVWLTDWLSRSTKHELANFGEQIAFGFGIVLTAISLENPTVRSLNLLFSTLTLAIVTQRHSPTRVNLVFLTHIMGLLTFSSIINRFLPNLSREMWASILLVVMVAEWAFSLTELQGRNGTTALTASLWQRSAWYIGLGLAGLSYSLLWVNTSLSTRQEWGAFWLITPLALTVAASQTASPRRELVSWLSVAAAIAAQVLTITLPGIRLIGLAVAAGLMLLNTRYLRQLTAAVITVGFCLSFVGWLLWDRVPGMPRLSTPGWFFAGAIALLCLWLLRGWLNGRQGTLAAIYVRATDSWAITLCSFELLILTLHSFLVYQRQVSPSWEYLITPVLIFAAIAYRSWRQHSNWAFYALGWSLELLVAEALGVVGNNIINLSVANIALGLTTQLLGEVWRRRHRLNTLPNKWHILPLVYGILGGLFRWDTFTNWTGLCTLAIALIAIGVGRRQQEFKPLLYLGIIGVSLSAYELLIYQLLQASGGAIGDGLIAMSALGTSIMYAYRILSPWLTKYLNLTAEELKVISHLHWAWSSCLLFAAIPTQIVSSRLVGLGVGAFLIRYAIFQGRNHSNIKTAELWVYLGLLEFGGIRIYWSRTAIGLFLASDLLLPWVAPLSCVFAYFIYILPWERWGWPKKPWQRAAYIVPLVPLWETQNVISPVGLLIVASFYIFLAYLTRQIRFSYISVALVDWALFSWFAIAHLTDPMWYITPIGLSLLYIAQFDPSLKPRGNPPVAAQRRSRHFLRLLGTVIICGAAFLYHQDIGILPGIFSIVAIFAGLAFRVRAFLYVGTAIFLINASNQLVILVVHHSFFKWVIGLIVGIFFIWIAANFETRREQLTALVRNRIVELHEWD